MRSDADALAHALFTHLTREEATLQVSLDVLRRVRNAMLRCDLPELTTLLESQEHAESDVVRMREERDRLRAHLADELGLSPDQVSFSTLVAALPGDQHEQLLSTCERVRGLARQLEQLVRKNATLVSHFLGFTQRLLVDITGGNEAVGSYRPDGTQEEASFGSLFSLRG